jgi:hypothetical protein
MNNVIKSWETGAIKPLMNGLEQFRKKIQEYRRPTGKSQKDLAQAVGLHPNVLSNKLNASGSTLLTYPEIKRIIFVLVEWGAIREKAEVIELLSIIGRDAGIFTPEEWLNPPFDQLDRLPKTSPPDAPGGQYPPQPGAIKYKAEVNNTPDDITLIKPHLRHHADWERALDVSNFFGHSIDLDLLEDSITNKQARIILLLGMAGLGKTILASKLAKQAEKHFKHVIWRSLRASPRPGQLLNDLFELFEPNVAAYAHPPETLTEKLNWLISFLENNACLIVLDGYENILQAANRAGIYQAGFEGFGDLLTYFGQSHHQSCLIITSREKPNEIIALESNTPLMQTHVLAGLNYIEAQEFLKSQNLHGTQEEWNELVTQYSGNPLALKLGAWTIREVFGGNIPDFLHLNEPIFGDIKLMLDQQFRRLSPAEQEMMFWLASEKEPVALEKLEEYSKSTSSRLQLIETLESLFRRTFIEREGDRPLFKLQPILREYITKFYSN